MEQDPNQIKFVAQVTKVQTMVDGGLRFVLDTSEANVMQAAQLMECKRFGVLLEVVAVPQVKDEQETGTIKRTKAKRRKFPGDPGVQ